ncbi:MAG: NERD domain-containing protein [Armatimonadetes bacterium]|nr:NERD domain-containing protein [Armatimonadota bacterium]MDE2205830.1 NERD domain-containing protein [Armatimonadota bacterium]
MGAKHIRCGRFANLSEREATEWLLARLIGLGTKDSWVLLSNLSISPNSSRLADELDLVVIGPTGIHLIEVKHWDKEYLKRDPDRMVDFEADKLNDKARRLKGVVSGLHKFDVGFVAGKLLLTRGEGEKFQESTGRRRVRGIEVFGRPEWRALLDIDGTAALSDQQVTAICKSLQPLAGAALDESLHTFMDYGELTPLPSPYAPFHQVYRGRRKPSRDRIVLHLFDLSASPDRNAPALARREFEAMQRLQKSPWLPSILDSFQYAPAYPGEIAFFSYLDTEAASLRERATDTAWDFSGRLHSALRCVDALLSLHEPDGIATDAPFLHRNLNPDSVRVRSNGEPLFTQLQSARIPGAVTVGPAFATQMSEHIFFTAPEIREAGLGAASTASDVYALCATLLVVFESLDDPLAPQVCATLQNGLVEAPDARCTLHSLRDMLETIKSLTNEVSDEAPAENQLEPPSISVAYWDEDTVRPLHGRYYRIITRLGSGGVGTTFKVVETDRTGTEEKAGPYVAKVFTNPALSDAAIRAYNRVRANTDDPALAGVLEVAPNWKPDAISALLHWVHGESLHDLIGVLPIHLEDLGESSVEESVLRWACDLCEGLSRLHQAGLAHGDVSPRNIIVNGGSVTLTDYDLVAESGSRPLGGTAAYCAPNVETRVSLTLSDDLFALTASLFHALFDRRPFDYDGVSQKGRGLNWEGIVRDDWPRLSNFFDRATDPDPAHRFSDARDALAFLRALTVPTSRNPHIPTTADPTQVWTEQHVPWLGQLLQGYPGSPLHGNVETRGLDSEFARATYVETALDKMIADEIRSRKISLVILCGNAGDGKTAFLQNLAANLRLPPVASAQRIWNEVLPDGLQLYANLDGSAAYQGRSANSLLNELFAPFTTPDFPVARTHLVAINDGPLLAWLIEAERSYLTDQLEAGLQAESGEGLDSRIRFVDLNARSLVGDGSSFSGAPRTEFLGTLMSRMLGEVETWKACETCSAQSRCSARHSVLLLQDPEVGLLIRERLTRALQAVHQRGEIHITARELRAALTYIFFGIHDCGDLHTDPALQPPAYYDRAFDPNVLHRQGELLSELRVLDPALDTQPPIDRELLREGMEEGNGLPLRSLRRRAYFEWPTERIQQVGGDESALTLARGRHLATFLRAAAGTDAERAEICIDLCSGIAHLEALPAREAQFDLKFVPLKITPRTPTETTFWINKRRERFKLYPRASRAVPGIDSLPTHLVLSYEFENGHKEELIIGGELFHLLLELKEGYQLTDAQSDDIFANLMIFKQRLTQEGDRGLFASNPQQGHQVFSVRIDRCDGNQKIILAPIKLQVEERD